MEKLVKWLALVGCFVCFLTRGIVESATIAPPAIPDINKGYHVGEFEQQQAILLGWDGTSFLVQDTLIRIVEAVRQKLRVIMLVHDAVAEECVRQQLDQRGLPTSAVQFARVPSNSIWARDFGPMSVKTRAGDCWLIDSDYLREAGRPEDDLVPTQLGRLLRQPVHAIPLTVEGGNLLSNGRGLLLTTTQTLESNAEEAANVITKLRQAYGADQVVVLEPLFDESTGHVDMFATFTSRTTVVVGQYDPAHDPVNAAVLDRNADLLASITTPHGKLKVERIPMPPRADHQVLTYTNVFFANGTLLMPEYPGSDARYRTEAIKVYRRLLPKWKIVTIDCNELISMGGALHCVAMNLARAGKLERHKHGKEQQLPAAGDVANQAIAYVGFTFDERAVEFTPGAISHRDITRGDPLLPRPQADIVFAIQDVEIVPPPPRRVPLFGQPIYDHQTFEEPMLIAPPSSTANRRPWVSRPVRQNSRVRHPVFIVPQSAP